MQSFNFFNHRGPTQSSSNKGRKRQGPGQSIIVAVTACLFAAGCSTGPDRQTGEIGAVEGFLGGAIVEEPRAAVVASDTLSAGGSAADAAVAAFFTMTASYPLGASLGAGGACLVYDAISNQTQALVFMPKTGKNGGAVAIPTAVRAMAILHATYGRLRWAQLLAPGERYARFGHRISRALARRLQGNAAAILADPGLRRLFGGKQESGAARLKPEGAALSQLNLAAALSLLRSKGVAVLYGGTLGRRFIAASSTAGGKLTLTDLRAYRPVWSKGETFKSGNEVVYSVKTAQNPVGRMGQLLQHYVRAGAALPAARAADIATTVLKGTGGTGDAMGGSALAVMDRGGSAVACQFTLNGELGTGGLAPDLGFLMARVRLAGGQNLPMTPVLAVNHHIDQAIFALAASGGPKALVAAARVTTGVLQRGQNLSTAQRNPRAVRGIKKSGVMQEKQSGKSSAFGLVQAAFCPSGAKRAPRTCSFQSDPRGFGLAASAK